MKGTEEGCEAAAASFETLPIDWHNIVNLDKDVAQEHVQFCALAIAAASTERSISWRSEGPQ